jgi:hypothetical protein
MPYTLALALSLLSISPADTAAAPDSIRTDSNIRAAALRHSPDVRKCYENEGLRRNPHLVGSVEVFLTILPTGAVSQVAVKSKGLEAAGGAEVARCVQSAARNWMFDRGPYIVETVILPFNLVREPARVSTARRGASAQD